MSRGGGFRGRGGARGGRGGARGGMPMVSGGLGISMDAFHNLIREPLPHSGELYPPLEHNEVATLPRPTNFEEEVLRRATELDEVLRKGIRDEYTGEMWAGWRLPEVRKQVGIEIETFADREADKAHKSKTDAFDRDKLKMDHSFFPPSLWDACFAPDKELDRVKKKAEQMKKRKRVVMSDDEDEKPADADEMEKRSDDSGSEDFDFEDESDHQDYDANYFDNGEGDDDEGGEEEDDGGGGYDD